MSTPQDRDIKQLTEVLALRSLWRIRGRKALEAHNAQGFNEAFAVLTEIDALLIEPDFPVSGHA